MTERNKIFLSKFIWYLYHKDFSSVQDHLSTKERPFFQSPNGFFHQNLVKWRHRGTKKEDCFFVFGSKRKKHTLLGSQAEKKNVDHYFLFNFSVHPVIKKNQWKVWLLKWWYLINIRAKHEITKVREWITKGFSTFLLWWKQFFSFCIVFVPFLFFLLLVTIIYLWNNWTENVCVVFFPLKVDSDFVIEGKKKQSCFFVSG